MLMRPKQPFTEIETIRQQLDKVFDQRAATGCISLWQIHQIES